MTIKEAMMRALDNATDFPLGWNTELADVFRKCGKELYKRRQKKVWVLRIVSAYSDEPPKVVVCRSRATAVELMDKDICDTLAGKSPRFDPTDLVRLDDNEAKLGDEIVWSIVKTDFRD